MIAANKNYILPRVRVLGCALLSVALLASCSLGDRKRNRLVGATLDDIKPIEVTRQGEQAGPAVSNNVSLDDLEKHYQHALETAIDPGTRRTILIRLADILMLRSEDKFAENDEKGKYFDEAIQRYQELIQLQQQAIASGDASDETNRQIDQMLYQLSKAYALDGRLDLSNEKLENLSAEYSDSIYTPEAKFRRAERAFSSGDYEEAQALYAEVVDEGNFTPFYQNAIYMNGWSHFKRAYYEEAISEFTRVLDNLYGAEPPLKTIASSQQNLANDTMRVMSLSFSYLDGPQTLSEVFAQDKTRPYLHKLYFALGALYFEKERYRDSAAAYRQYVVDNPLSDFSPQFSSAIIDVYEKGDFPSLLVPAKEEFVLNYGIDSAFWAEKSPSTRDSLKPKLKVYLEELANFEYDNGQQAKKRWLNPPKNSNQPLEDPQVAYLRAADWYQQFIRTFPQDAKTPEMLFLMAEALNEAGKFEPAYDAYKQLAFKYKLSTPEDLKRGAEAGYATVLLAQKLSTQATTEEQKQQWQGRVIDQSLAFADKYPSDPRAVNVLAEAAQKLVAAQRQPEAIEVARRVTAWQPPAAAAIQRGAWLVIAQSEFDLEGYRNADKAYEQVLLLTDANDPERQSIIERRAASVYKLAEGMVAEGEGQAAIEQFLRVQAIAPDSDIAVTAQYDAGNLLMGAEQWQQAANVFLGIRQRYPSHPLTKSLYAKMVVVYQETEQWDLAGDELTAMASSSDDPELRRQSLLLAGELYQKSGRIQQSIQSYEKYIQQYPQPFDDRLETMNKLALVYRSNNDLKRYDYWQQQIIVAHDRAGSQQTERSLYLASSASNAQAKKNFDYFSGLKLTLPLKNSLAVKRNALTNTVDAYQKVINYGVAEFVTEASYYLGEIYAQLSKDLLNSQRPPGLNELALEQYEILLEEQAFPFEEKAIDLHLVNAQRSREKLYDDWVKRSFESLAKLSPGRYNKVEQQGVIREIY